MENAFWEGAISSMAAGFSGCYLATLQNNS
jgi:hypothetical protein